MPFNRVDNINEIVVYLQRKGYQIECEDDLHPTLLGENSYVGCLLYDSTGEERRVWIRTHNSRLPQEFRESAAEWLTKLLVVAPRPVNEVIKLYAESGLARGPSRIEAFTVLARIVETIGITGAPDGVLELPADHPWVTGDDAHEPLSTDSS